MDAETKNYLDAKMDATRAQNDARFAEILAKIDSMSSKIASLPTPPSIGSLIGIAASMVIALATIIGLMADRFDGGLAASGVIAEYQKSQAERDAKQDADFRDLLNVLKQR